MFGNQTSSNTFRSCRLNENIPFIFIEPYPESQFKRALCQRNRPPYWNWRDYSDERSARILGPRTARLSFWTVGFRHNRVPGDCARVFSRAAAILKSEKTLGTRLRIPLRGSQDWFSSNGNSKQTTNTSKTFELAFPSRSYEIFRLSHILGPAAHRRCLCSKATICPTGLYLRDRLSSRLICLAWLITCFAWPLL